MIDVDVELKFMMDTAGWPLWPFLPLKRWADDKGAGLLIESGLQDPPVLFWFKGQNLLDFNDAVREDRLPERVRVTEDDLRALIEDGWMVD